MNPSHLTQPLSRLASQPLQWLWPGRLARGKLSIFDGDPQVGKSLVTLDLCARLTTGRPFPDNSTSSRHTPCAVANACTSGRHTPSAVANVLILNGEDSAADTVIPRLRALGADLDRAHIFSKNFLDQSGPFRLPTHTDILDRALSETRAALVILDPIMAFLDSSIQALSDMSVRRALSPLAAIAEKHACHIIMVRHLNKSGHFRSTYRGGGSIGLLAACRSAYLFAADPHDPLRAVMAQIKNNLAPRQPSLAYRLREDERTAPVIEWLGESPLSADQLLVAAGRKPNLPQAQDRACDFLFDFLKDGPRSTLDIWQAAREEKLSQRTLRRIRRKCKIRTTTVWANNRALTYWLLPGQKTPTNNPDVPSLEPWLAPLREMYPADPLDDSNNE